MDLVIRIVFVTKGADLKGVTAYNRVDIEGLYTLGTVVVDYRGYRVIAQSIIPGNNHILYQKVRVLHILFKIREREYTLYVLFKTQNTSVLTCSNLLVVCNVRDTTT